MTESPDRPTRRESSRLSFASLALAVVALALFWSAAAAAAHHVGGAEDAAYAVAAMAGVILGLAAVVTGFAARRRVKRGAAARGGVALAGIVLGIVAFVVPAALLGFLAYLVHSGYQEFEACVRSAGTSHPSYLCLKDCPVFLDSLCRRAIGWSP